LLFLFFRGQALCTTAAVIGGKSLASQISEKIVIMAPCIFLHGIFGMLFLHYVSQSIFDVNVVPFAIQVALSGGVLFIVFGIQSFLSTVE
jgi:putative Ca2+/H+ antiporter (TMEM165/GDT1 family)